MKSSDRRHGSDSSTAAAGRRIFEFGEFELDEDAFRLRRSGEDVPIDPRPLAVLGFLCANNDRYVTKDELLTAVWDDAAVSEGSVFTALRQLRRVLGDSGREQTFIRTRRGTGYRLVVPVSVRGRGADGAAGDFVGRADTVDRIHAAIGRCEAGRGGILLLAGEAGIGKTRVLDESLAGVAEPLRAWCWEDRSAPPYWPWIQLVRELIAADPEGGLGAWVGGSPLAAWVDESGSGVVPTAPPTPSEDGADARFRLFAAMRELLARASAREPRILVIEDLHWADASSLGLLDFLAYNAGREPWLLLGSYRDAEASAPHPLRETLGRLRRKRGVVIHPLEGLAEEDVAALIAWLSAKSPSASTTRDVRARTSGNPLWIRALYGLRGEGQSDAEPSLRHSALADVLAGLAANLSADARGLLECASVLGAELPLHELAELSAVPPEPMQPLLEEARRVGLIVFASNDRIRFAHALIQEVLYQSLPVDRAWTLHARAAETLIAANPRPSTAKLTEIVRHLGKTVARGGASQCLDYARRAAERALQLNAFDEAAAHFAQARAALDFLPDADELERCDLLLCESDALARAGSLADSIARSREALAIAREQREPLLWARAALGCAGRLLPLGTLDPGDVELLEEALGALPDHATALRAELLVWTGVHASGRGEFERCAARMEEGVRVAQESGDVRVQALARRTRAYVRGGETSPIERIAETSAALELSNAAGDHEMAAMALFELMAARLAAGEIETADRSADDLQRRIEEHRLTQVEPFLLGYRATRALMAGRFAECEQLANETIELAKRLRSPVAALYFGFPQLGELRRLQGRSGELAGVFVEVATRFPDQIVFVGPAAVMLVEAGEVREASALMSRAAEIGLDALPTGPSRPVNLATLAEAAFQLGDESMGPKLYELARPHAEWFAAAAQAQGFFGPVAFTLALAAELAGWAERADAHFEHSLAVIERLECPALAVRVRVSWAQALSGRRDSDAAMVRSLLAPAIPSARSLGMRTAAEEAERLLEGTA